MFLCLKKLNQILKNTIFLTVIHSHLLRSIKLNDLLHIFKDLIFISYMHRVIRVSVWDFIPNNRIGIHG